MKKYLLLAAAVLAFSCSKSEFGIVEDNKVAEEINSSLSTIKAVAETDLDTKTTYEKIGDKYNFSWVTGDIVSVRLVKDNSGTPYYDRWKYRATSTSASTTLTAVSDLGTEWSLSDYAFYPMPGTLGFDYTNDHNNAGPEISLSNLNTNTAIPQTDPYKVIPMIGVKKDDNTYSFKAATGVLKVSFTNLPASLSGKTLILQVVTGQNGGSTAISGTCSFPKDECTLAITSSGSTLKQLCYTISDPSSVSFYVPIPECTIAAKDVKFTLYESSLGYFIDHFVNPKEIKIERGVVTELPAIDYASIQGSLSYVGTPDAPKVSLSKGPRVAKVKYTVANDIETGNNNINNNTNVVSLTSNGVFDVSAPASSGSYYIVYKVYNSNDGLISSGSFPFAYISSTISEVAGVYYINGSSTNWSFVLAEETQEEGYNVKITQYNSNNTTFDGITGNVYGKLDREAGTLTFKKDQTLSKGETSYYVVGANTIGTGSVCKPDDYLVFTVKNEIGPSNKLVFHCDKKFGIITSKYEGTGQQFNPCDYYQSVPSQN